MPNVVDPAALPQLPICAPLIIANVLAYNGALTGPSPERTTWRAMVWPDQHPPATDVILHLNVPCAGGSPAYLEIDKLPDDRYRATVGTLFEHQQICRTRDLDEAPVWQANAMAGCRSFDDIVSAFRAMRTLGGCGKTSVAQTSSFETTLFIALRIRRRCASDVLGGVDPAVIVPDRPSAFAL